METRIIKVFYNQNCLPFKDKELTVHFPIIGNVFMGASNTTEIRFYVGNIDSGNKQWVVIGKLPNGKRGFKLLGNSQTDDDGIYYPFLLSQFFTQAKGDLFLSLGGYVGGEITLNDDDIYELDGNLVIETTSPIRLNIAYSTPINGSDDEIDTWQEFLGALGLKANKSQVIIQYSTYSALERNFANYDEGQLFFAQDTKLLYKKENDSLVVEYDATEYFYTKGEIDTKEATINQRITSEVNTINGKLDKKVDEVNTPNIVYGTGLNGEPYPVPYSTETTNKDYNLVQRSAGSQIKVPTEPITSNDSASKGYVDTEIAKLQAKNDVIDVVGNISELEAYDTQEIAENDIINVLSDSLHDNASTFYKLRLAESGDITVDPTTPDSRGYVWVYIGEEGPFLTPSEADNKYQTKIIAYPLLNVSSDDWVYDEVNEKWNHTINVSSDTLSLGTYDKYMLGANDVSSSDEVSNCGINIKDISTSGDTTTVILESIIKPSKTLNLSVVIAKVSPSSDSGITWLTRNDLDTSFFTVRNNKIVLRPSLSLHDINLSELRVDNGQYQMFVESLSNDMAGFTYVNNDLSSAIRIYQGVPEIYNESDNYKTSFRVGQNEIYIEVQDKVNETISSYNLIQLLNQTVVIESISNAEIDAILAQ